MIGYIKSWIKWRLARPRFDRYDHGCPECHLTFKRNLTFWKDNR